MARPKIVNKFGTLLGWNNITFNILGREIEGIDEIEYSEEEEVGVAHGAGKMPIGKTRGNYKASSSIGLYAEEIISLQQQLPKGSRLSDIPDFDATVTYEFNGTVYTDIIRNCTYSKNMRSVKNGDGKIVNKFDLVPSHMDWNV
jgi:hypothetical protein